MTSLFWLSFCDESAPEGEQFKGAALVEADDLKGAVGRAWATGCNPGGQVMSVELNLDAMPNTRRVRLARAPRDTLMDKDLLRHYDLID